MEKGSEIMKDKDKIKGLNPIDENKYENVDLDHLVMYAMGQLNKIGADLSFENAVIAAFKLFPKKFSLTGYSEFPDSDRVMNCLNRCTLKNRRWLGGKSRQGYIITERSSRVILKAEELLHGWKMKKSKVTSKTRRKERILEEAVFSPAYMKYTRNQKYSITKAELCYFLQGTLDSSQETLKENLKSLKNFAEELSRKDVLDFLNWLEERFKKFLNISTK